MSRNYIRPTREERERNDRVMALGCILSRLRAAKGLPVPRGRDTLQHLVMPGKRHGHGFTICLKSWYHQRVVPYPCTSQDEAREIYGASIAHGSKAFLTSHGVTEWDLWEQTQNELNLPTHRPVSKRVPRVA